MDIKVDINTVEYLKMCNDLALKTHGIKALEDAGNAVIFLNDLSNQIKSKQSQPCQTEPVSSAKKP